MGLDTFAAYPKNHKHYNPTAWLMPDNLFKPHTLCGGMFSGSGNSFRGKVYDGYVTFATGVSLYTPEIPNEAVKAMADALEDRSLIIRYKKIHTASNVTTTDSIQLAEWFRTVADNGGVVVGDW